MDMRTALILVLALPSATTAATAVTETVTLDPGKSKIEFTLGDVLHTVHGSFRLSRGFIQFDSVTGKATGNFIVDAVSGDSGSNARDSRMKKNILETDKYPEIEFRPDLVRGSMNGDGLSHLDVHGMFRIHGGDHEMTLPVDVQQEKGQITIRTHFDVPYVDWGMKNPSTFVLRVEKTVRIDITGVASATHSQ